MVARSEADAPADLDPGDERAPAPNLVTGGAGTLSLVWIDRRCHWTGGGAGLFSLAWIGGHCQWMGGGGTANGCFHDMDRAHELRDPLYSRLCVPPKALLCPIASGLPRHDIEPGQAADDEAGPVDRRGAGIGQAEPGEARGQAVQRHLQELG